MVGNHWEVEVYGEEPLLSLDRCDESELFGWMTANLPADGGKIAWNRAVGNHIHWQCDGAGSSVQEHALAAVKARFDDDARALHAGDSLSPFGTYIRGSEFLPVMRALLEIPEHHYVLAEDRSWLFAATVEGDFDLLILDPT